MVIYFGYNLCSGILALSDVIGWGPMGCPLRHLTRNNTTNCSVEQRKAKKDIIVLISTLFGLPLWPEMDGSH